MKKSVISLLLLLFLGLIAFFITYALFESDVQGDSPIDIAGFRVIINGTTIDQNNYRFNIDQVFYESAVGVVSGKLTPNSMAHFDIVIDTRNVDVAFTYNIELAYSLLLGGQIYIQRIQIIELSSYMLYVQQVNVIY